MKGIECETCIKRKTMYCPNSSECFNTKNKPYYQNRIMLLEENQSLKKQLEETQTDYEKEKYIVDKQTRQLADEYKNTEYQTNKVKELENQLKYLISGEYLNQLKFERNMLENIIQNGEISKDDKEFIDMTHRNTELLDQQKEFIECLTSNINLIKKEPMMFQASSIQRELLEEILSIYKEINHIPDNGKTVGDDK